jgi:beta-galactosidase
MTSRISRLRAARQSALSLLAFFSIAAIAAAAGPPRIHETLDFGWRFLQGDDTNAISPAFDDSAWRTVTLPHDWSIEGDFNRTNAMSAASGYLPSGIGWYRRTFTVPPAWNGKRVMIEFEGVYMNADVWLNGEHLGFHPYGYTEFHYDVTPQLKMAGTNTYDPTASYFVNVSPQLKTGGINTLVVKVDNSRQLNSRWYSGSGIYRHVWLTVTDPVHIAPWGVYVTTPQVSAARAQVQVQTAVRNDSDAAHSVSLQTRLMNPSGNSAGTANMQMSVPAHGEVNVTNSVTVTAPKLWSLETPSLYRAVSVVNVSGKPVDEVQTPFGIRSIKVSVEKGLEINGKPVEILGGCIHHDLGCLGAAAFDRAEERRVELLKAAGFMGVRTAHNPPSTAFLEACDRLGMLVLDEAFDCWERGKNPGDYGRYFTNWWQRDIDSMVLRDRNHPSVIFWSIGNEVGEQTSPAGARIAKMLATEVRSLDNTRFITAGFNQVSPAADGAFASMDVAGYNYQVRNVPGDHARVTNRVIVCTESRLNQTFESWTYVHDLSYFIGDFVWTAWDYIGEAAIGRFVYSTDPSYNGNGMGGRSTTLFPTHGSYCGDLDLAGFRKPISHYRNIVYDRGEKLFLAVEEPQVGGRTIRLQNGWSIWPTWESWTWPGLNGTNLTVEIYSRCDKVQLYLNDKLIGEKPTTRTQEFWTTFRVPYTPGTLRAVGLQNGRKVSEQTLTTVGDAARIRLTPDHSTIKSDGQDLSYITVEVTDKSGQRQPNADQLIHFSVSGPGVIAGVDNGSDNSVERYQADHRTTWHGRALVVVRSSKQAGPIKLTATSPGLADATVTIQSRPAAK